MFYELTIESNKISTAIYTYTARQNVRSQKLVEEFDEIIVNDSEDRLISICKPYNLKITNIFFEHKNIHRCTKTLAG